MTPMTSQTTSVMTSAIDEINTESSDEPQRTTQGDRTTSSSKSTTGYDSTKIVEPTTKRSSLVVPSATAATPRKTHVPATAAPDVTSDDVTKSTQVPISEVITTSEPPSPATSERMPTTASPLVSRDTARGSTGSKLPHTTLAFTSSTTLRSFQCNPALGWNCVDSLWEQIQDGISGLDNDTTDWRHICRELIPQTRQCVGRSMRRCSLLQRTAIGHTLELVIGEATLYCRGVLPIGCSPANGSTCFYEVFDDVYSLLFRAGAQEMCNSISLDNLRSCLSAAVAACPSHRRTPFNRTLTITEGVLVDFCESGKEQSITAGPGRILCYHCDWSSTNDECNMKIQNCNSNLRVCQTVVETTAQGQRIQKGCVYTEDCKEGCGNGRCEYCCDRDLCNFDDKTFPGNRSTTPRPRDTTTPSIGANTSSSTPTYSTTAPITTVTDSTESCKAMEGMFCVSNFTRQIINESISEVEDFTQICSVYLPATVECVHASVKNCRNPLISSRVFSALGIAMGMTGQRCDPGTPTPCDTIGANHTIGRFGGIVDDAEESGNYSLACGMVGDVIISVNKSIAGCDWYEKQTVNENLQYQLDRVTIHCDDRPFILIRNPSRTITIVEGGFEEYIYFEVSRPPSLLCPPASENCQVVVRLELETGTAPRCHNQHVISQVVFGMNTGQASTSYCTVHITDDNWQKPHRIPLLAKLDFKYDGLQIRRLAMVLEVYRKDSATIPMQVETFKIGIEDQDHRATCSSLNDPHITTFDGHYYNNFYEGVFTLYKNTEMPFQVQVIYQKCHPNSTASCNCAAAIQSGDSVLYVDRCRRTNQEDFCRNGRCVQLMKYGAIVNDRLTPGTRIFQRDGGRRFEILLPHGTQVKIQVQDVLLNIWIVPSPADFQRSVGLCGYYDGQQWNDLTMTNGSIYVGTGRGRGAQPRPFSKAWRTPEKDRIFSGVVRDPFSVPTFCECNQNRSHICHTAGHLELCDFDTRGEITDSLPNEQYSGPGNRVRRRRSVGRKVTKMTNNIDLDETFEPPDMVWAPGGAWEEKTARQFCRDFLVNSSLAARQCQANVEAVTSRDAEDTCVEDIKITSNTTWASSAVDAIKEQCMEELRRNMSYTETDAGRHLADAVANLNCINECSGKGTCVKASCQCMERYGGADCSVDEGLPPFVILAGQRGLCDVRDKQNNCSDAVVYGENFVNAPGLVCHMVGIVATPEGIKGTGVEWHIPATFSTFNQVRCPLPMGSSNNISVSNPGGARSDHTAYIIYDSVCFTCDGRSGICNQRNRTSHCLIDGRCYKFQETHPQDECLICVPLRSHNSWTESETTECKLKREEAARINEEEVKIQILVITVTLATVVFLISALLSVIMIRRCRNGSKKATNAANAAEETDTSSMQRFPGMVLFRNRRDFSMFESHTGEEEQGETNECFELENRENDTSDLLSHSDEDFGPCEYRSGKNDCIFGVPNVHGSIITHNELKYLFDWLQGEERCDNNIYSGIEKTSHIHLAADVHEST